MPLESIAIFTDGASRGNPGPGGYAAIIIFPAGQNNNGGEIQDSRIKIQELGGREEYTTNNRMELRAAIEALSFLSLSKVNGKRSIVLYTDSSYLVNGITKWIHGWQKNGWKTKAKKDVENKDLWIALAELAQHYANQTQNKIKWELVKGHVGVAGNVRCDQIAQTYAELTQTDAERRLKLYSGPLSGYPIKNILDVRHDTGVAKEKSSSRARTRAAAYSYVSAVDGFVQTHKTWAECEKRVKGMRGAKYKKAFSSEEERLLIREWQSQ